MNRARAKRTAKVALASAIIHIVLLFALAIGVPRLGPPRTPDQPAVQVTLERLPSPLTPSKPPKPPPSRPRQVETAARSALAAPSPSVHETPPTAPAAPPQNLDVGDQAAMGDVVRALRGSVGCSRPDAVGLTDAEREACRRRFHAGLETAKPLSGLTAEKRARFDRTVQCRKDYQDQSIPPVTAPSNAAGGMTGLGYIPRLRDCPPSSQ